MFLKLKIDFNNYSLFFLCYNFYGDYMKKIVYFFTLALILTSCSNTNSVSNVSISSSMNTSYISSTKNYDSYSNYYIDLNKMFEQNDNKYGVYFFSRYCPACNNLKDYLFNYLDNKNKSIDNLYLVNLDVEQNGFDELKDSNGLSEEDIINNTIGASKINEVYFRSAPCVYIIKKIDGINKISIFLLTYPSIENFLVNDIY